MNQALGILLSFYSTPYYTVKLKKFQEQMKKIKEILKNPLTNEVKGAILITVKDT